MTAARLIGLMYSYDKNDDLGLIIRKGIDGYIDRFGVVPSMVALHPGTEVPVIEGVECVYRKYIRANHILVGVSIET